MDEKIKEVDDMTRKFMKVHKLKKKIWVLQEKNKEIISYLTGADGKPVNKENNKKFSEYYQNINKIDDLKRELYQGD